MVHVLLTHVNIGLVSVLLVPCIVCHETNNTTLPMLKYFNKCKVISLVFVYSCGNLQWPLFSCV